MKARIEGLPKISVEAQEKLGQAWLRTMFELDIPVDGVHIRFIEDGIITTTA